MGGRLSETRLDEYDKTEWFDVCRLLRPGLTEAEYTKLWDEFQERKAEHERTKGLQ
jgi:hypothetical protein